MNRARLTATLAATVAIGILAGCASNRDEVPPEYAYVLDSFPPIGEYRSQVWYVYRRTGQLPPTAAERLEAWEAEQAAIVLRKSLTDTAVRTFIDACVKTAGDPDAAPEALEAAGMKQRRAGFFSGRKQRFSADFGTAAVFGETHSDNLGQCSVQPADADPEEIAALLAEQIAYPESPARRTEDPAVYILDGTDTYVVFKPETGEMIRTQRFPEKTDETAQSEEPEVAETEAPAEDAAESDA